MRVAIIPARGGSKRIPRKNIIDFCGKPMICWSIDAANGSGCFDQVIVSTDDPEIAHIARDAGAEVPFVRPQYLSGDTTPTIPVICHALQELQQQGLDPLAACCIYATAPFLRSADLKAGLSLLSSEIDYVVSVASFPYPVQRALRIGSTGTLDMADPDMRVVRSQDLEERFHDAGQFYWGWTNAWLEQRQIFAGAAKPLLLPRVRVQDIDTPEDLEAAATLFTAFSGSGS